MATRRRTQFVRAQTAAMVGSVLALVVLDALTLEIFFIISLVSFLVLIELTAPFNVAPDWRTRFKWLVVLGLLGFGYLMIERVLGYLPPGVF